VWVNKGPAPHTVTSKTASWKYNKNFTEGQKLSYVFAKAGTYRYVCTIHPGMVGTIVVK
jgi:plastocyanin